MAQEFKSEQKRINGYLKEVVTFFDKTGKPISQVINPLMVELRPRDVLQIFVGAFLVAAPLCFTEEVWNLSIDLKRVNVIALGLVSFTTVASYIYLNFYRYNIKGHVLDFIKRTAATYIITISSIILILLLIDKLPILGNPEIAIKRVVIIGFPSLFGAVISDSLK